MSARAVAAHLMGASDSYLRNHVDGYETLNCRCEWWVSFPCCLLLLLPSDRVERSVPDEIGNPIHEMFMP